MPKYTFPFDAKDDIVFHLKNKIDFKLLFDLLTSEEKQHIAVSSAKELLDFWLNKFTELTQMCNTNIATFTIQQLEGVPHNVETTKLDLPKVNKLLSEWGVFKTLIPVEYGGYGALSLVGYVAEEIISRASSVVYDYIFPTLAVSDCIARFGSEQIKQELLPKIAKGELSGSIAFTEESAGSDLSRIKTYYKEEQDGSFKIFGQKTFVINGNANICLVLAKDSNKNASIKNLALFIIKRNEVSKDEFQVSTTSRVCSTPLSFDLVKINAATAQRLTKEGSDTRQIFQSNYRAKIARGFQALGLMEQSLRLSSVYAKTRTTWGKPLEKHESITEKLIDMRVDTQAFRSLCYQTAYHLTYLDLLNRKLKKENLSEQEKASIRLTASSWSKRLHTWLPLVKWWAGEHGFVMAKTAVQIYGARGVFANHPAQELLQSSISFSIYDGTSQMQAWMSVKETLKNMTRRPSKFIETALGIKLNVFGSSNRLNKKLSKCKGLFNSAVVSLMFQMIKHNLKNNLSQTDPVDVKEVISTFKSQLTNFEDMRLPLLHAERLCEMKTIIAMSNCIVRDAKKDPQKAWVAERFMNKNMLYLTYIKSVIESKEPILKAVIDQNNETEFDDFAALKGL